ncbi:MAG: amidohydrolase family protein, partial [Anaerolineaceae bacterium]|nr:amidohydrolase family protein [Anaerolineaceae bacterium]
MIIDADVHITPETVNGFGITIPQLIHRMDRSGVDKALTWLTPLEGLKIEEGNNYVYQAASQYPDRILGFGWANPRLGQDHARDMVKRCIDEYGFHGVKLNGAQNDYFIDDPHLTIPVIEEIAKTGKLLAFHVGMDAPDKTHPNRVAKIAELFPELRILMVHMGGVGYHDMSDKAIEVAAIHENITLIGSAVRAVSIRNAIHRLGADRVCFGSDTPFNLMWVERAMYEALMD